MKISNDPSIFNLCSLCQLVVACCIAQKFFRDKTGEDFTEQLILRRCSLRRGVHPDR